MRVPKRKSEEFRKYGKPESGPLFVTQAGLDKLKSQLVKCERELPELIAEVQRTGAFGDFSENAEYQAAKYLMRKMHGRVAALKDRLKRAQVIAVDRQSAGTVQIGSTVVVETGGKQFTFEILGSYESNPARGRISHQSPLGQALVGRMKGDYIKVETPRGRAEYLIKEIR
jgi:transcription elongation factor GreA